MIEPNRNVHIAESDLSTCALLVDMRFGDAELEASRTQVIREFLAVTSDLEHALHSHGRCTSVNHRGTRGNDDVMHATATLFSALMNYTCVIGEIAARFRTETAAHIARMEVA